MSATLLSSPAGFYVDAYSAEEPPVPEEIDIPEGYELVDGELMEKNVGTQAGLVAAKIVTALENHAAGSRAGWVFSESPTYRCFPSEPGKSRRADASFILRHRLTRKQTQAPGSQGICPDLVVEVVSTNDHFLDVDKKRKAWLAAGVKLVWVVNPEEFELTAYRPDAAPVHFHIGDTLTAEPLLPGFRVPMAPLFESPDDDAP